MSAHDDPTSTRPKGPHDSPRTGMTLFLAKRLLTLIATLIGASVIVFLVLDILPGNAAEILMGADASHCIAHAAHGSTMSKPSSP